MGRYVLGFSEIDRKKVALVGSKCAQLAELSQLEGIVVPAGFCVTTEAFRLVTAEEPSIGRQLDLLSELSCFDRDEVRRLSGIIRQTIEDAEVPADLLKEITQWIAGLDERAGYAVRSSATMEDLPTKSGAGQLDTYLNISGSTEILRHVRRCWSSLFTERAVTYRLRNGFDQRDANMAVIVQEMVHAEAAGVMFTADPVTSNRRIVSIEAYFGLGESMVSGLVNPDVFRVRDGGIVAKAVTKKDFAIIGSPSGGTQQIVLDPEKQRQPALTDLQVVRLAQLGRLVEAHFGRPQDIEWCLHEDNLEIVQCRPITTLFPIPVVEDQDNHVYVSVGHQQMMTDPMKPLGVSLWQLTAARPMYEAAGRLFVDISHGLAEPTTRASLLKGLGRSDPLIGDALQNLLDRDDFIRAVADDTPIVAPSVGAPSLIEADPKVVDALIRRNRESGDTLRREIVAKSGSELVDFILADIQELKRILFDPQSSQVIEAAIGATWWLNDQMQQWLGEENVADTLTQSVDHNITSEMGFALLEVADKIRPFSDVVGFLKRTEGDAFLDELGELEGGRETRDAIVAFLDRFGMRCAGEIDLTRPRWSESPGTLLPIILSNVKNFKSGEGERRFEQGRIEAWEKELELLERLRALPDGERKAQETKRMIDRLRTYIGYREDPKYGMVCRYFLYKQALLDEAERLVGARVLRSQGDIFFLTFQELRAVVDSRRVDEELIDRRIEEFRSYRTISPPRVYTSDGEIISGVYRRENLPAGALVGLPVSTGTVVGRARVVLDLAEANLKPGDILVTPYADPSFSILFLATAGLVTEVGGQMTHGAVIAREYGLPAVVGVEHATKLIKDGDRIRVNGTDGYVEFLPIDAED